MIKTEPRLYGFQSSRHGIAWLSGLLVVALSAACVGCSPGGGNDSKVQRKLLLRESGIPLVCNNGTTPAFEKVRIGELEWLAFHQEPLTRCEFELTIPPGSQLSFRLVLGKDSQMRNSARVIIRSQIGDNERELVALEIGPKKSNLEGKVELPSGQSTISLSVVARSEQSPPASVDWSELTIESTSPCHDECLPWVIPSEQALAPFLEAHGNAGARRVSKPRLLIVGADGANWNLMERLLERGEMPALNALRARGSWGTLRSSEVPESAMGWSALRTGVGPGKNGTYSFYSPLQPRRSFWHFLGDRDFTSIIVAVPTASALRPPQGVLIQGWDNVEFSNWASPHELIMPLARAGYTPKLANLKNTRYFLESMRMRTEVSSQLLKRMDWDLAFVVFEYTDTVGHRFGLYTPEWDEIYQAFDQQLAGLLELADEQTTILVVSDHGWRRFDRSIHLSSWLKSKGFEDWKGNLPNSANLVGISRHDVPVGEAPKDDRDSHTEATTLIRSELLDLRDPETGERVIERVRPTNEVFGGRYADQAPGRLLVEANENYRTRMGNAGRKGSARDEVFSGSSDTHGFDGIYLLAGPGIKPGEAGQASIYDITPTVLNFFGIPPPADADGETLADFGGTELSAPPPEPLYFPAEVGEEPEKMTDPLEEDLRALGYIE